MMAPALETSHFESTPLRLLFVNKYFSWHLRWLPKWSAEGQQGGHEVQRRQQPQECSRSQPTKLARNVRTLRTLSW